MTKKVDLNIDIKQSTGDYFPTVYLDFIDVSYGEIGAHEADPADDSDLHYSRYSMDPENGTWLNGSLSIYFTKEAFETAEDTADWIHRQYGDLYVYTFLSPFQTINRAVDRGVLSTKALINAFAGSINRAGFSSDSGDFHAIVSEMKEAFLSNTWRDTSAWRTCNTGDHSPEPTITEYDTVGGSAGEGECTRTYLEAHIDKPGSWVYNRFWGKDSDYGGNPGDAMNGPWTEARRLDADGEECYGSKCVGITSFMRDELYRTLASYSGLSGEGDTYNWGTRVNVQRLRDLVYNSDGSTNVIVEGMYDKNGDQIAKIANVPIQFWMSGDTDERDGAIRRRLADVNSVHFLGVVGRNVYVDSEIEIGDRVGSMKSKFEDMGASLFDANFGDITYQQIFKAGVMDAGKMIIADQTEEIFVKAAGGEPHPAHPIMSINGTYHASDPINYETIVSTMNQLVQKYSPYIDEDRALTENLANLVHILGTKAYSVDILLRLQFFRRAYYQKSTNTKSGKLYESFKRLLYSLNRQVMMQPRLKKIRITNNKIIDSRITAPNVSYTAPRGTGNCVLGGGTSFPTMAGPGGLCKMWGTMGEVEPPGANTPPDLSKDNAYLPRKWHHMARRTINTMPIDTRGLLGEMSQYLLEEGLPTVTVDGEVYPINRLLYASDGAMEFDSKQSVTSGQAAYWAEIAMASDNEGAAYGATDAFNAWQDAFQKGRMIGTTFPNPGDEGNETGHANEKGHDDFISQVFGDIVVENTGFFTFDYEKALQSHSMLSFVLSPWRIQRYLGLHVPYDLFRIKHVKMTRREAMFLTTMGEEYLEEIDENDINFVDIQQELIFRDSRTYPCPKESRYTGYMGADGSELYYRYGQPTVRVMTDNIFDSNEFVEVDFDDIDMYSGGDTAIEEAADMMGTTYDDDGTTDYELGLTQIIQQAFANESSEMGGRQSGMAGASIVANLESERKSFLTMVNFDLPLGTATGDFAYKAFANPTNRPSGRFQDYEGTLIRGGYRTLTFQYRDFMDDDVAYYNTIGIDEFLDRIGGDVPSNARAWAENRANFPTFYNVEIELQDQTLSFMDEIYDIFESEYNTFIDRYYNQAMASCSFNNIDDRFNDFFIEGVKTNYPNPEDRYWIRAPYMLNLGRQLFFKTFEDSAFDSSEDNVEDVFNGIRDQSARTARLIGPDDGRLLHLKRFARDYEKFLNIIKPRAGSTTTDAKGRRLFGAMSGEYTEGSAAAEPPIFQYHPVYDRMLDVADLPTDEAFDTDEEISRKWEAATTKVMTHVFKNAFPIDQEIYGDMFLSNVYSWEYEPENTEVTYDVIWEWLEKIPLITSPKRYMMGLHDDESGIYLDTYWPVEMTGFYDRAGSDSPGYAGAYGTAYDEGITGTLYSDSEAATYIPSTDRVSRCSSPPDQLTFLGRGTGSGTSVSAWTNAEWESFIDQTLLCAFLYRFGFMIASSMGVQFVRNSFADYAYPLDEGSPPRPSRGDDDADKNFFVDYTINEICDYLLDKYATLKHGGDLEAASAELPGLDNLRRAATVIDPDGFDGPASEPLWSSTPDRIWSDKFLSAVCMKMQPEIVLTEITGLAIESAIGGDPYWKYMRPQIFFKNLVWDSDSNDWIVAPQRFLEGDLDFGKHESDMIGLLVQHDGIACGYHYHRPRFVGYDSIPSYGNCGTTRSWIEMRRAGCLDPAEFDYRYPYDCIAPTQTGGTTATVPTTVEEDDNAVTVTVAELEPTYVGDDLQDSIITKDLEKEDFVREDLGFPGFDPNIIDPLEMDGLEPLNYDPLGDRFPYEYDYDFNDIIVGNTYDLEKKLGTIDDYINSVAGDYVNVTVGTIIEKSITPVNTVVNSVNNTVVSAVNVVNAGAGVNTRAADRYGGVNRADQYVNKSGINATVSAGAGANAGATYGTKDIQSTGANANGGKVTSKDGQLTFVGDPNSMKK